MITTFNTSDKVFVFGSNLGGNHGTGAAKYAKEVHGAKMGTGVGRTEMAYAIPTKDADLNVLSLKKIGRHLDDFMEYAKTHNSTEFMLTRIGCGRSGYTNEEIMRLLPKELPENVYLPGIWRQLMPSNKKKNGSVPVSLAVVGSRDFNDSKFLFDVLDAYADRIGYKNLWIVSGGARGVDAEAEDWAERRGVRCWKFVPEWDRLGKRAGFLRNPMIVWAASETLAFWDHKSTGTASTIDISRATGLKTSIIHV